MNIEITKDEALSIIDLLGYARRWCDIRSDSFSSDEENIHEKLQQQIEHLEELENLSFDEEDCLSCKL